ncbi:helix-turn-helix transcriptional regulator [Devosia ginsengisoli]|uniref:AlpA family phage regulatory protein n=1 Tax=Devosia ginsengisoli TaxID=400770 RepID=A0A5B8LUP0_9HYPH|nr:AlpA family phage regulatory protein [Devosia ginsengisoli]QDZ11833.1 AlpA family phage regulatory protein [Devosia ginsengisoli]
MSYSNKPLSLDHLLNYSQVEALTGFSRSTILRLCQRGDFPQPLRIAGRARWRASELKAWMEMERSA